MVIPWPEKSFTGTPGNRFIKYALCKKWFLCHRGAIFVQDFEINRKRQMKAFISDVSTIRTSGVNGKRYSLLCFLSFWFLCQMFNLNAQSIGTTSSYGCGGGGEVVFYIAGGSECGSPQVTSQSSWSVTPSTGVSITYVQTSSNPVAYNQIRVTFTTANTYSIGASYFCPSDGSTGSASPKSFTVYPYVTPNVTLTSNKTTICGGGVESVTFTASPTNGGSSPTYSWAVNGSTVSGQSASTYTTSSLSHGDAITVTMYSNKECASPSTDTSDPITISVNEPTPVTVSIISTYPEACTGEGIAFTASLTGEGLSPTIQWFINGGPAPPGDVDNGPLYLIYNSWNFPDNSTVQCFVTSSISCAAPKPAESNIITMPLKSPDNFFVNSITIEPFRYPAIYCAEEVTFKVTASHPATFYWYKNNEPVGTGPTYDPVYYYTGDIIKVIAEATSTYCLQNTSGETFLDHSFFSIEEPVGPAEIFSLDGSTSRCMNPGSSSFYATADNAKNFLWTIATGAGPILASGTNNSTATVQWNELFSGTAAISVTATGCQNDEQYDEVLFVVHPKPVTPSFSVSTFCDFEIVHLKGGVESNIVDFRWYSGDGIFLSQTLEKELSVFPAGNYMYQAEAVSNYGCISATRSNVPISVISSCDEKMNWIETMSYNPVTPTGSEIISHSKSYFDGVGNLVQLQSKDLTTSKVWISQGIKDQFQRNAIAALSAPSGQTDFQYKHWFVTDVNGNLYDYTKFDQPVGSSQQGTLGWYYSANNNIEDHVPVTQFPFARTEFYQDGSDEVRRSARPGEKHRLGQGHEVVSGTFPVFAELTDYSTKRNTVFGLTAPVLSFKNAAVQTIVRDENGKYAISISDKSGRTIMSCRQGSGSDYVLSVPNNITSSADPGSPDYRPVTYFYILHDQTVTLSGNGFIVENILTDGIVTETGGVWPAGFYRISLDLGGNSNYVTLGYNNYFLDVSYQFYDDAGRLRASVSPNGYRALYQATAYDKVDKTIYHYNHQGWLLSMTEPDAGTTKYLYRTDGKIRFSQNALQAKNEIEGNNKGKFSYTLYDESGRPVESGEYTGTLYTFSSLNSQLEYLTQIEFPSASKTDWVKTHYDRADPEMPALPTGFEPDFLRGVVSWTENINIKTWYSYDELGRVTWMAQKPNALDRIFVTKYKYDFLGNVLEVLNASCISGNLQFPFYHHYQYDADQRLAQVHTSTDGSTKKLRATYEYYLHGPLKRIELGDQIQGIDFVYNIHGWLTQINHPDKILDPGGDSNDVFGMILDYYESSLQGVFQSSGIFQLQQPQIFHNIPGMNEPLSPSSLAYKPPILLFKDLLLKNLEQIKESLQKKDENNDGSNKTKIFKVGAINFFDSQDIDEVRKVAFDSETLIGFNMSYKKQRILFRKSATL